MNRLKFTMTKKQETMKKYLFKTRLLSFAALCGIALTFASCAKEDVAQNTTGTEGDNDKNLTTFVAGDEAKTRTSLDYNSSDFYWEAGDYIYVKDDDGVLQKSSNAPTSKVASFKYMVPGKFAASSSYKVYYLGKNSSGNSVTISTNQKQTTPDNTEHFGTAGDYGTVTATKVTGKQQFKFELDHQPAYLVFLPYTTNTVLKNCFLTKIEVSADNDIAETYTINSSTDDLTGSAGGKQIVLTVGGSGSSKPNGFPLTNSTASVTTNGAYMVIKPGTHTLKVRYWVKDIVTNVEGTITRLLPSTVYAPNTYYDMNVGLDVHIYDGDHYYMWDAQEQYWKGHEWNLGGSQPTLYFTFSGSTRSNDYAKNNTDSRYYHEGVGTPFNATQSCSALPNVNEMVWYAKEGDPRWDTDELWATMGHLYKGGIWLKKRAYISGFNADSSPDGIDRRITLGEVSCSYSYTLPSTADANKYFFLPALGRYTDGALGHVGLEAEYWSSSGTPGRLFNSYSLFFYGKHYVEGGIRIGPNTRSYGARIGVFE